MIDPEFASGNIQAATQGLKRLNGYIMERKPGTSGLAIVFQTELIADFLRLLVEIVDHQLRKCPLKVGLEVGSKSVREDAAGEQGRQKFINLIAVYPAEFIRQSIGPCESPGFIACHIQAL